ncbi:MAG: apolipoprotein N-acyltransferase [Alistipes sp.]|nr:apolipoprotein N-acyltransferase [Alistipes senegalensis]MCM1250823.1 apolipoprotein N-acyltransferase [Alistipes sp.]
MSRKIAAVIGSVLLLSGGWLSLSGLTLPFALVPLLWIASTYDASRRSWRRMLGWATLAFALWNAATIWWIWYATPVGPVAATLASTTLNLIAFMLYFTVAKRAPKALAYTVLVAAWIATEYWYTVGEFSWPWLILGNGFSHDVWAVQWYEYTGVFGGSLWVLVCNILFFEAWQARRDVRRWAAAGCMLLVPIGISLGIWFSWRQPDEGTARVTIVQPDVDCYDKFHSDARRQERNIVDLLTQVPADAQFVLLPETALPGYYREPAIAGEFLDELLDTLRRRIPGALLVTGANTVRNYPAGMQNRTARPYSDGRGYYDIFNAALGLDSAGRRQLHRKGRLVIGVEKTPMPWLFEWLEFLVIDLGGTLGQIGVGQHGTAFTHEGIAVGPAICYEGLYGDFYGDFVRRGAQFMAIISNDGWWGDTPGYRHLFTISRLRAVEHRRAIARSANTGRSGFISARGDVGETLGWEARGTISASVPLNTRKTFYTRYGDYIGRIAEYVLLLSVLYFVAYRVKKRNYLVQ